MSLNNLCWFETKDEQTETEDFFLIDPKQPPGQPVFCVGFNSCQVQSMHISFTDARVTNINLLLTISIYKQRKRYEN